MRFGFRLFHEKWVSATAPLLTARNNVDVLNLTLICAIPKLETGPGDFGPLAFRTNTRGEATVRSVRLSAGKRHSWRPAAALLAILLAPAVYGQSQEQLQEQAGDGSPDVVQPTFTAVPILSVGVAMVLSLIHISEPTRP